jgi:hypothetical protein
MNRPSASTTTAVTVVPSSLALATAESHSAAGMRMDRGSVPRDISGFVFDAALRLCGEQFGNVFLVDAGRNLVGLAGCEGDVGLGGDDAAGGFGGHGLSMHRCSYTSKSTERVDPK